MTHSRPHPPATKHGAIQELFHDVFFVTGTMEINRGLTLRGSRNMTIVRVGDELTLINSVRLDEAGLRQLEALGNVRNVIRLGSFHGMDDPFYKERCAAVVWSVNAPYNASFNPVPRPEQVYFEPDVWLTSESALPIPDARFIEITSSTPIEAVLLLERENGVIVSGDCFQNVELRDPFSNTFGKLMMKIGGFVKPFNIGPGWYRVAKPDPDEIAAVLKNGFQHVIPAHGKPVVGDASNLYGPTVAALQRRKENQR